MKIEVTFTRLAGLILVVLLALPAAVPAQSSGDTQPKAFSQEQLEQLLAPVALYPDSLLTQILMASTYPLEIAKAMNWMRQNKGLKDDALTAALEKQQWDPSVKSLVNFPQVLQMMSDKLDWTQQLGDAFIAQQKDVMDTVQKLRAKARAAGNLKTTKEQTVVVQQETQTIIIEPANPQVVYVPAYNPTVVYGVWPYPAYPPYYAYPPGYAAGAAAFGFATGVAVGAAWGYAWGHADWHGGNVDIDVNRNANINRNIDRNSYERQYQNKGRVDQSGKGTWQHDASHRQGVAYRDSGTAQKFGQQTSRGGARGDSRGYADRGGADMRGGSRDGAGRADPTRGGSPGRGGRESAFGGAGKGGSFERSASERGQMSRGGSGLSRGSGGFGGSSRGSGGFGGRGRR